MTSLKTYPLILLSLIIFSVVSCDQGTPDRFVPDTSEIDIDTKIVRYDQALMALDTNNLDQDLTDLYNNYPDFSKLYFEQLTGLYKEDREAFVSNVSYFLKDKRIKRLQELVNASYSDMSGIEADLIQTCKYLKYYFPDVPTPVFYTLFSEFAFQSFIFTDGNRDAIGIGLDMFLGDDFEYKNVDPTNPAFSEYLARSYNKAHIVKKSMDIFLEDILGQPSGKRFIDQIIHKGKKLYIAQRIMPTTPDSIIFEFSQKQWEWLNDNELQIWSFFLDKELMYETDHLKINKYVNNSPHSQGMPIEAPGRTGQYIGFRIVEKFMQKNPDFDLIDLIRYQDAQKLMEISKYKPNRR